MRRIIGNLDFETRLAIEHARASERGGRRSAMPSTSPAVLDTVSSLATLLRALATEGDHLWTPHLVDPARVAVVPGLPRPALESGPEVGLKPASALLAWGETREIARQRERGADAEGSSSGSRSIHPVADWLWASRPAPPEAVARVNHRGFCLELARDLGYALPGARLLESVAELEAHLAGGGAAASPSGEWVLKAPFSAAGRERLRGRGAHLGDGPPGGGASRSHAGTLFARYGTLLFEPWLDRIADFGCCALLDESECRIVSLHRQEVDGHGRMKELELPRSVAAPRVNDEESTTIRAVTTAVGCALSSAGYRGPFGIDGWWHRGADGQRVLHPLGEINARMSFGLVARVLVDRLELELPSDFDRWVLRFGDPGKREETEPRRIVPLVRPANGSGGAWLELPG